MEQDDTLIQLDLMKKNVYDLQEQLQNSYKRINDLITEKKELEEQVEHLRNRYEPTEGC